jgi:hypothetical protein
MSRSPSVNTLIKDLEANELREVIRELSKLTKKNEQFIKLFLQSSSAVDTETVVSEAKKKVYNFLYGRSMFPKLDLGNARKTVNEYSKLLREYPSSVADLKLYYVELGTEITNEFGDMDERFYSSLESMFSGFCKLITKYPMYFNQFETRINELQSACQYIGWGYGDRIDELAWELKSQCKES